MSDYVSPVPAAYRFFAMAVDKASHGEDGRPETIAGLRTWLTSGIMDAADAERAERTIEALGG